MSRTHIPEPQPLPLSRLVELDELSQAGLDVMLEATPEERERLARWAGVTAVHAFSAAIALRKHSQTRFLLKVEWRADVEQACVVTLEPVVSHLEQAFRRELYYQSRRQDVGGELSPAAGDDDTPDAIDDLRYDAAAPLLEEFSLAIDPYPRRDGVHFEPPDGTEMGQGSPFAALNALKEKE